MEVIQQTMTSIRALYFSHILKHGPQLRADGIEQFNNHFNPLFTTDKLYFLAFVGSES